MKTCNFIELERSDLQSYTRQQLACSDCIKAYCPSRTVAFCEGASFIMCGAKQISGEVLDAYRDRIGSKLQIERPC